MATYSYRCPAGHIIDKYFKIGKQWGAITCTEHRQLALRDFPAEIPHQSIRNDDPFRKAWLGDAEQRAAAQGRCLDPEAPHDKFEAKERHERLGRVYIGDDYSQLNQKAVKAIEHGKGLTDF